MIASAVIGTAPVLRQTVPKRGFGTSFERMGSHSDDTRPVAGMGTDFAGLAKEIDASLWPIYAPGAFRQPARATEFALELGQQLVKLR